MASIVIPLPKENPVPRKTDYFTEIQYHKISSKNGFKCICII